MARTQASEIEINHPADGELVRLLHLWHFWIVQRAAPTVQAALRNWKA